MHHLWVAVQVRGAFPQPRGDHAEERMREKRGQEGQGEEEGGLEAVVLWPGAQWRAGEKGQGTWNQQRQGVGGARGSGEG